jgi:hypothetical protein
MGRRSRRRVFVVGDWARSDDRHDTRRRVTVRRTAARRTRLRSVLTAEERGAEAVRPHWELSAAVAHHEETCCRRYEESYSVASGDGSSQFSGRGWGGRTNGHVMALGCRTPPRMVVIWKVVMPRMRAPDEAGLGNGWTRRCNRSWPPQSPARSDRCAIGLRPSSHDCSDGNRSERRVRVSQRPRSG